MVTLEQAENMETLLRELKKLVSFCGWTYGVIWKIGPDHRTPVWYLSYLNEEEEREIGQAQRFEKIYKCCQFTAVRPGYAYTAWHRQSPSWWLREVTEPVPTDEKIELFLTQAKIQTLVCFPGRVLVDGTGFCVELASTSWVPENEVSKASIREFISTSIAPYISSPLESSNPLLQELLTAAADEEQDTAILTNISSQAALHGDEELAIGNIGRRDIEPYYSWTIPSSHPLSADHNPVFNFSSLDGGAFIPVLQEPFVPEWTSSRKGKEILEQPVPTSLQLEYLEKLRRHPSSVEDMLPSTATASSSPPSRDSVWLSSFERYRHSQLLTRSSTKRPSMIYKWVTALAPLMRAGPGGGGERDDGLSSDPRSPNSRMLDHQAAVIHKHAERRRRSNMNNKLRTLISIVPTIDKKKDKISVLSSTIDYIRQLTSRISSFENKGEGASTSGMKEDALDFTKVISSIAGAPNVVVESLDEKTWLIKVQANYHPWSLLHILNMFQDLRFEVTSMDYSTMDGWFGTNISIKHPKNSNTSCSDLKDIISRGLESGNNLRTISN